MTIDDSKLDCSPYLTQELRSEQEYYLEQVLRFLTNLIAKQVRKVIAY